MARPSKPLEVIRSENKSHRTKAELRAREENENAVLTGLCLAEFAETKQNKVAHEKFKRVCEILERINKLDAIYETVINRYCLIYAETSQLEVERAMLVETIYEAKETFSNEKQSLDDKESAALSVSFIDCMSKCLASITKLDDTLMKKRKMLLDIEKENVMTIAAALRSIPKTPEEKKGPSLKEILGG